ncbi:FkbM family methyltransferase [Cytophaga hutchinsonii]|uniref:SAM-dependent methyltransferase n=1 Tax=Cytophaga hutchinsonii (strain ATCC 33406 / DSM 1761 / CIP 103989 / NBRC 15051 / NCIMB 9469 / D465) TaxID=269798 RepID=A0A6N4SP31_CYTH3|nr:FkbM family methyltransferase [Cytophaga hutchinsonii]ABG58043.1 SAM-dependent methyltransferase [Cytophaga hutchinsonii ATCC 33406]SFX12140.1 methyltransferase, FkbM family [Cytophaga hutchinsonii ATCC 33406]
MASVNSPIRTFLKPLLFKLFGKNVYARFQFYAKIKDIDKRLVEEKEMELLPYFLNKDSNSIDVGANYAYYTVGMSKLSKKVFAYEPIPFTYKVCKMLLKHYNCANVDLFAQGVGEKNEIKRFNVPVVDFGGISAGQAHMADRNNELKGKEQHYQFSKNEAYDCTVVSLDAAITDITPISFVKMDIEGAEYFALKGMQQLLLKHKPVILIEINPFFLTGFDIKENDLKNLIASHAYKTYIYSAELKKLQAFECAYFESNYILIPEEKIAQFNAIIE